VSGGTTVGKSLRELYPFRMKVRHTEYTAREIIPVGTGYFDVLMGGDRDDRGGLVEADGSFVFGDIGGQRNHGWNPNEGHGGIFRVNRDDSIEALVPHGNVGSGTVFEPRKAPANFGEWHGHIFFVGQTSPGRPGATRPHAVYKVAPGERHPETFVLVPDNGKISGGKAGAMMPGVFGRAGTPLDQSFLIMSYMNCTIYRVSPAGGIEPYLTLDFEDGRIMPQLIMYAPPWWGDLAGELILFGVRGASFETGRAGADAFAYWRVTSSRQLELIENVPVTLRGLQAPREFGPFAGDVFFVDEGPVNLAQIAGCDEYKEGLPLQGRIWRWSPKDRTTHLFAEDFQGSYTSIAFDGPRLIIASCGLSYCTGEFHEPDGAIWEIRHGGRSCAPK
jgi:hypothetical protein